MHGLIYSRDSKSGFWLSFTLKARLTSSVPRFFPTTPPCHLWEVPLKRMSVPGKLSFFGWWKLLSAWSQVGATSSRRLQGIPVVAFPHNQPGKGFWKALEWSAEYGLAHLPRNRVAERGEDKGGILPSKPTSWGRTADRWVTQLSNTYHNQYISALNIKSVSDFPL